MADYKLQDLPEFTGTLRTSDLVLVKVLSRETNGRDTDCKVSLSNLFNNYLNPSKFVLKGGDSFFGDMTFNNGLKLKGLTTKGDGIDLAWVDGVNNVILGSNDAPMVLCAMSNPLYQAADGTRYALYHQGNRPTPGDIGAAYSSELANFVTRAEGFTKDSSGLLNEKIALKNTEALYAALPDDGGWADILTINAYGTMEIGSGKTFLRLFSNEDASINVAGTNYTLLHNGNAGEYSLPLAGGVLSGDVKLKNGIKLKSYTTTGGECDLMSVSTTGNVVSGTGLMPYYIKASSNPVFQNASGANYTLYHQGNKPTAADVGALPLAGGTLTGSLTVTSGLEIKHSTPFIDFHFANSTADYTTRIIEQASGSLTLIGDLTSTQGLVVYNAKAFSSRLTDGTVKPLARITAANDFVFGDVIGNAYIFSKGNPSFYNGTSFYSIYHQGNKPSAADVGALPLTGGTVTGATNFKAVTSVSENVWLNSLRADGSVVNMATTSSGVLYLGDRNAPTYIRAKDYIYRQINGQAGYKVYDEGNKPSAADVGAYTKSEVDAKVTDASTKRAKAFCFVNAPTSTPQTLTAATWTVLTFSNITDPGSNFDSTNSCYVAPYSGYYSIASHVRVDAIATGGSVQFANCISNSAVSFDYAAWEGVTNTGGKLARCCSSNARIMKLDAGQKIYLGSWIDGATLSIKEREMTITYLGD